MYVSTLFQDGLIVWSSTQNIANRNPGLFVYAGVDVPYALWIIYDAELLQIDSEGKINFNNL